MTVKRFTGATFVDVSAMKRWNGSAWVDLTSLKRWNGSAWIDLGAPVGGGDLSAIVAPALVSKLLVAASPPAQILTTTAPAVVTATGGTAPYTYSWAYVSGDSAIYPASPTSNSSYFSGVVYQYDILNAVWRCTVTDAAMDTVTVDVNVRLNYQGTD